MVVRLAAFRAGDFGVMFSRFFGVMFRSNTSKQQYNIDLYLISRISLDKGRLRFYN